MVRRILITTLVLFGCIIRSGFTQDISRLDPPSVARTLAGEPDLTLTISGNYFWPPCSAIDANNFCITTPPNNPFPKVTFGLPGAQNPPTVTVQSRQLVPSSDPNHPAFDFPRPGEILVVTIPAGLIAQSGELPNPGYLVRVQTGGDSLNPVYGATATLPVDWRIDTIAGTGIARTNGDMGQATAINLYYPASVAFDGAGYMYIADTFNNCIRRVNLATGQLNTFAGVCTPDPSPNVLPYQDGPAASALMLSPWALTFDPPNPPNPRNLYFADTGNHVIRKINLSTLMITTVAGMCVPVNDPNLGGLRCQPGDSKDEIPATTARLTSPRKIVFDNNTGNQQNYYIVDNGNHRIRRVDTNGTIHAFACDPTQVTGGCQGYAGDGGPVNSLATAKFNFPADIIFSSDFTKLYVADLVNQRVRAIDMIQNNINNLVGTTSPPSPGYFDPGLPPPPLNQVILNFPVALALDPSGNLYISDRHNLRVRQVFAGQNPNTFIPGVKTFVGIGTAGFSGNRGLATNAKIYHALGIAWDSGKFYVADNHNHQIRVLSK